MYGCALVPSPIDPKAPIPEVVEVLMKSGDTEAEASAGEKIALPEGGEWGLRGGGGSENHACRSN